MNYGTMVRWILSAVLVLVFFPRLVLAQDDAAARFERLVQQADDHNAGARYQEMEKAALELKKLAEGPLASEPRRLPQALLYLGIAYEEQGRYAEAEEVLRRALDMDQKLFGENHAHVARHLHELGLVCSEQGSYSEAETYFEKALGIYKTLHGPQHTSVAMTLRNMGILYGQQARYAEAEGCFQQALQIDQKTFGPDHRKVAMALANLGNVYEAQGRCAEGETAFKQAIDIFKKVDGSQHPGVAIALNNLGNLYRQQGRYDEAEPLYKQALEIDREVFGDRHLSVAQVLNNLGGLYRRQARYSEAERSYKDALEIRRELLRDKHPAVAESLNSLALLYSDQGRRAEAEPMFKEALKINREFFGDESPRLAPPLLNLANVYRKEERYAEAEAMANEVIRIQDHAGLGPDFRRRDYSLRAVIRWALGRREEALADLRQAMQFAEDVRGKASGGEIEQATAFEVQVHVFDLMVAWQVELGGNAEALDAMERSRARSLLDQMELQKADLLAGLSETDAEPLRRREVDAQVRLSELRKQLALLPRERDLSPDQRRQREEELTSRLRQAQREVAEAYADVRNASPAYRLAVGKDRKPVTLDTLHEWAKKHQSMVLEYLIGPQGAYLLTIPCDGQPRLVELRADANQARVLGIQSGPLTKKQLEEALTLQNSGGVLARLRECTSPEKERELVPSLGKLWEMLIPPEQRKAILEGKYGRLIVIPDGPLARLPFEVLVVELGEQPRYLLDVGPLIEYAPSATILVNLSERPAAATGQLKELVLSVGDCRYGAARPDGPEMVLAQLTARSRYRSLSLSGELASLYYSAKEIDWASRNFDRHGVSVASLKGDAATEKNVCSNAPGRRVLHLACHGLVDEAYGNLFGALALTPGPDANAPADDGFLTLAEVYRLDLRACELVVLSACDSNVGPEQRGEGVWALSRGFLVAGARRAVASNWLVDDEAAASLISHFCGGMAVAAGKGMRPDYAQCLQEAKRWVRGQEKWQSPYYWGTFVLLGPP